MTDDELEEIRKRAEAATPGPWDYDTEHMNQVGPGTWIVFPCADEDHQIAGVNGMMNKTGDADFIAHARSDIPALLLLIKSMGERIDMQDVANNILSREKDAEKKRADEAERLLAGIKWKSADKDNMEFAARITCFQLDEISAAIKEKEHDNG